MEGKELIEITSKTLESTIIALRVAIMEINNDHQTAFSKTLATQTCATTESVLTVLKAVYDELQEMSDEEASEILN